MNRRRFLKSGALWVPPLFAIGRARGAVLTLADPAMVGRTRPAGSSLSCPPDGSPDISQDGTSTQSIGEIAAYRFHGCFYTAPATKQLCKVGFKLKTSGGDISGKTYTAYVYTLSGTTLDSVITNGTSTGISGSVVTGTAATVLFPFTGNPTLNSGTTYAIVVTPGSTDATNFCIGYYNSSGSMADATFGLWRDNLQNSYNPGGTSDAACSVYWYD